MMARAMPPDCDMIDLTLDDDDDVDFSAVLSQRIPWLETPLKAGTNTIRILKLHRGNPNDQVSCSLSVACLDDRPEYETLSYVWGDPAQTRTILVSGAPFEATINLVDFLCHLRLKDADRMIWADAICIDQSSEQEKEHQLKLMTSIYREGKEAHIWFGAFTDSWVDEIIVDQRQGQPFVPSNKMTAEMWHDVEQDGRKDQKIFLDAGGVAPFVENYFPGKTSEEVFREALEVLDCGAAGMQMHEFPLYLRRGPMLVVNRHWPVIMDCIRWMVSRPWWSRVWTYQEVLLPKKDSTFHTSLHTVAFSRLLNGIEAFKKQQEAFPRYIKYTYLFWAHYQDFPLEYFFEARHLHDAREKLADCAEADWPGVSLRYVFKHLRYRKASDTRDHFLGLVGILEPNTQHRWWAISERGYSRTAGQIFAQCTKAVFAERDIDPPNLTYLSNAIGDARTKIHDLPSWAIDLTSASSGISVGSSRWHLYNACPGFEFKPSMSPDSVISPELHVEGIKIGSINCCESFPNFPGISTMEIVHNWMQLYLENTKYPNHDVFWRTAFMDRNIYQYHLHERKPLWPRTLKNIKAWWSHVEQTDGEDMRDVDVDTQHGDGRRGDYHARELRMNTRERFFMTRKYEPGLGTHSMRPGDEIYVLKGSNSPVVLRSVPGSRTFGLAGAFKFIGFCYVAKYMYGEALNIGAQWSELVLI